MPSYNFVIFLTLIATVLGASFVEKISENDVTTESQNQNFNESTVDGVKSTKLIIKKVGLV